MMKIVSGDDDFKYSYVAIGGGDETIIIINHFMNQKSSQTIQ